MNEPLAVLILFVIGAANIAFGTPFNYFSAGCAFAVALAIASGAR